MSERGEQQSCGILIIDDEPSVADALKLILEDGGYRVSVAPTGSDGIEQSRRGRFCLTITDLRLPDMTGLDVIAAVCRDTPRGLFILITSYGSDEVLAEARNCGATEVLLKPFSPAGILRLVESTLADHRHAPADGPEATLSHLTPSASPDPARP